MQGPANVVVVLVVELEVDVEVEEDVRVVDVDVELLVDVELGTVVVEEDVLGVGPPPGRFFSFTFL